MKVVVSLAIEISDPGMWTEAFGEEGEAKIIQGIKNYVYNEVLMSLDQEEVGASVTLL